MRSWIFGARCEKIDGMRWRVLLGVLASLSATDAAPARGEEKPSQISPPARQLFVEAQSAYQNGRLEEARKKLEQVYRMAAAPELAFNIGRVCERVGDTACGAQYFRLYLKTGKPTPEERQDIEARIREMRDLQRKQRDQVFTTPPSGTALAAEARKFFLRGVAMFKDENYLAALQAFTAAQRFSPVPELYFNMGVTAELMKQPRDAIDYFREYLRLRPKCLDRPQVEERIAQLRSR